MVRGFIEECKVQGQTGIYCTELEFTASLSAVLRPEIVASSCTYLRLAWAMEVIIIDI